MNNSNKKFVFIGLLSGFFGAACCLVPLVLMAVGLGAAATAFNEIFEPYSKITLITSFIILTLFVLIRNKSTQQCTTTACTIKAQPYTQILIGIIVMLLSYYILHDVIPPFISKTFFKQEHQH